MNCLATPLRTTRLYRPNEDLSWLHGLWQRTMDRRWSISLPNLQKILSEASSSLVAEEAGTPVGFCAAGYRDRGPAGILILLVEPAFQRRGIASVLLETQEARLKASGIHRLNVGFGNEGDYFWPGIPMDAISAKHFFANRGWDEDEPSFDLVRHLGHYSTPSWVYDRLSTAGVHLRLAEPTYREKIMAFERYWFPHWAKFFQNAMANSEHHNVLFALDSENSVAGAVILKANVPALWNSDFGTAFGTLNVLGVNPNQQGKGIGIALAAKAMEILKERQCRACYIQWTGLVEWYGKLGATVWAEYRMSSKILTS